MITLTLIFVVVYLIVCFRLYKISKVEGWFNPLNGTLIDFLIFIWGTALIIVSVLIFIIMYFP